MKKIIWIGLGIIFLYSLIAEFALHHESHFHYWFNNVPLFWILFGFFGCVALILFGKKILAAIVYKKEDYYE